MAGVKGNKGGGRKSAYQERRDARDAESLFFDQQNQEELETKIRTGKFSVRDRYLLTAMEGDSRILSNLGNKTLPDVVKTEGEIKIKHIISVDE